MAIRKQLFIILKCEVDMCVCVNSQHLRAPYGYVLGSSI